MSVVGIFSEITKGEMAGWGLAAFILCLSLVQISPLKWNPWDSLFSWLGKKLNGETDIQIRKLQDQIRDMWINSHRHSILRFGRELRVGVDHSHDEWSNILAVCAEYEAYCREFSITNGVVRADTDYIRSMYQELSHDHKIV